MLDDLVGPHSHGALAVGVGELETDLGEDLTLGKPPKRLRVDQHPIHVEYQRAHLFPACGAGVSPARSHRHRKSAGGTPAPQYRSELRMGSDFLVGFRIVVAGSIEEIVEVDGRLRLIVELVALVLPPFELIFLLLLFLQLFLSFFEFVRTTFSSQAGLLLTTLAEHGQVRGFDSTARCSTSTSVVRAG